MANRIQQLSGANAMNTLRKRGLLGQTSEYDKALMMQNPAFGNDVINYKTAYNQAASADERARYNDLMNVSRARNGAYTGGLNGMEYNPTGNTAPSGAYIGALYGTSQKVSTKTPVQSAPTAVADVAHAPDYNSPYLNQIKGMISGVGQPAQGFSYNYANDPTYQALLKMYTQNAEVAGKNTLARAAAMTGGSPSTYAVQAATAAGNQELNQLANMIPTLQQQEYARWSDQRDYNQQARLHALNAMLGLEDDAYKQYGDKVDRLYYEDKEGYTRNEAADKKAWDRGWQELEWDTKQESAAFQRALDEAKAAMNYTGDYSRLEALYNLPKGSISAYMAAQKAAKGGGSKRGGGGDKLAVDMEQPTTPNGGNGNNPLEYLAGKTNSEAEFTDAVIDMINRGLVTEEDLRRFETNAMRRPALTWKWDANKTTKK